MRLAAVTALETMVNNVTSRQEEGGKEVVSGGESRDNNFDNVAQEERRADVVKIFSALLLHMDDPQPEVKSGVVTCLKNVSHNYTDVLGRQVRSAGRW